jgi:hypothetical protein
MRQDVADGYQGFPECEACQCYPECRNDCPNYLECVRRLPEYAERVFGSDKGAWPADVRKAWEVRGYALSCPYCYAREFTCGCGAIVSLDKVVDIFHVGRCDRCGYVDEPCRERTSVLDEKPRGWWARLVSWIVRSR